MKKRNPYYTAGIIGLLVNLLVYVILFFAADPYLASAATAFFPVWIIILVIGYRKAHPRQ